MPSSITPSDPHNPLDRLTLDESLGRLLLTTLQGLSPSERVAFVLHDVFGVPYDSIANVVGRTPTASKALAQSARARIRGVPTPVPAQHSELVDAVCRACADRDPAALTVLLAPGAVALADAGGRVRIASEPVLGAPAIAALLDQLPADAVVETRDVNGQRGLVFSRGSRVIAVACFDVRDGLVHQVWLILNPHKLLGFA